MNRAHAWLNEDNEIQIEASDTSICDISHSLNISNDPKILWELIETIIRVANDEDGEPWELGDGIRWMELRKEGDSE